MIPSYQLTGHWPESLKVHRDDRYHSNPAYFVGREVVITEKLDGGLTQFAEGRVYARSSFMPTGHGWFTYVKSVTLPKLYGIPRHLMPIGEDLYGVHSIVYDPLPDTFFLFHVLDRLEANLGTEHGAGDRFFSWDEVETFAAEYDLRTAPVRFRGRFDSMDAITKWFMDEIKKPSNYGPTAEGFVMRVVEGFAFEEFPLNMCKFVRAHHVQTDEHWSKNWQPAKIVK